MTPLHLSIEHEQLDEVKRLLGLGEDPNQPEDHSGFRPLQRSVDIECERAIRDYDLGDKNSKPEATITRVLLNAGANPFLADKQGLTAVDIAQKRNHREALALFERL